MNRFLFLLMALFLAGCSVERAMQAPDKKNLNVFQSGTARLQLIAEVGTPVTTEYRNGQRVDIFVFKQGMHKELNYLRAAGYGAAFVLTGGISEVLTYPVESEANFPTITAQVTYDEYDSVVSLEVLKDGMRIKAEGPHRSAASGAPAATRASLPQQPNNQLQ
ncbi:MAG: hypothetical protein VX776_04930 [Planctomycetota bacterium]|nr:hypothetical protein [Planctomycetota bacterium]